MTRDSTDVTSNKCAGTVQACLMCGAATNNSVVIEDEEAGTFHEPCCEECEHDLDLLTI